MNCSLLENFFLRIIKYSLEAVYWILVDVLFSSFQLSSEFNTVVDLLLPFSENEKEKSHGCKFCDVGSNYFSFGFPLFETSTTALTSILRSFPIPCPLSMFRSAMISTSSSQIQAPPITIVAVLKRVSEKCSRQVSGEVQYAKIKLLIKCMILLQSFRPKWVLQSTRESFAG